MPKRVLILWSGGIDSTSVLKYYLEQTNFEIVALKIKYITSNCSSVRIMRELDAIKKLLPELQSIRPFRYEMVNYKINTNMAGMDVIQFGTMAIYPANSFKCEEIIISFTSDAHNEKYASVQVAKLNQIADVMYNCNKEMWGRHPRFVVHQFLNTKKDYILNLGNLVKNTWFCRKPTITKGKVHGCGKCHACNHVIRSVSTQLVEI